MGKVLKDIPKVTVILEDDGLVRKEVNMQRRSGFQYVPPEVAVKREIRALKKLKKVKNISRFIRKESPRIFYINYVEGTALYDYKGKLSHKYFDNLTKLVKKVHSKGVYRIYYREEDILINPEGDPALIDFGNVLFHDDPKAKLPGLVLGVKIFHYFRFRKLRRIFTKRK
jgi:RIO-like serine/threonine protein kinase